MRKGKNNMEKEQKEVIDDMIRQLKDIYIELSKLYIDIDFNKIDINAQMSESITNLVDTIRLLNDIKEG